MTAVRTSCADILEEIRAILRDRLAVFEEELSLDTVPTRDLGADSLDLLEIAFSMSRSFRMESNALGAIEYLGRCWTDSNGEVTDAFRKNVQLHYPFFEWSDYKIVEGFHFEDFFTIRFLCRLVAHRLNIPWVDPA